MEFNQRKSIIELKYVKSTIAFCFLSLTILVSQLANAGFVVEIKPVSQQKDIPVGVVEPIEIQPIKHSDMKRQHSSRRARTVITPIQNQVSAPAAIKVSDIPALPQGVPIQKVQTRIEIPAIPPADVTDEESSASQIIVALKPEVSGREVLTSYENGMPGHVSLIIRSCLNFKNGQPLSFRKVSFSDGELQIKATTDRQGCFQWYQDLYLEDSTTPLEINSIGARPEPTQHMNRYFKYYKIARWMTIEGENQSARIEFFINPFLSTTIDGSAKIDASKLLNSKNLSFTGEMFNF